jgi:hypothetical protein
MVIFIVFLFPSLLGYLVGKSLSKTIHLFFVINFSLAWIRNMADDGKVTQVSAVMFLI